MGGDKDCRDTQARRGRLCGRSGSRNKASSSRALPQAHGILEYFLAVAVILFCAGGALAEAESGAEQVRADLIAFLEASGTGPDISIRVPPLSAFDFDRERYAGAMRTELSSRTEAPYRGRVAVTVSLFAGERLIKRAIVSPYVQVGEDVVVAVRDLRRGEILSPNDLEIVERDQARLGQGFFGQVEDVVGLRLRRSVRRGKVIVAGATEEVPVVERGDRVIVVLESGAMRLQSIGRAQEAGGVGEWIRVLNTESKKEVSGRLDRSGRVHVAF